MLRDINPDLHGFGMWQLSFLRALTPTKFGQAQELRTKALNSFFTTMHAETQRWRLASAATLGSLENVAASVHVRK